MNVQHPRYTNSDVVLYFSGQTVSFFFGIMKSFFKKESPVQEDFEVVSGLNVFF